MLLMGKEQNRVTVTKIAKVILIVLVAFIVCGTVFCAFKLQIDGRSALREAKNIRLALRTADIEMYAKGQTIFNVSRKNGLEAGVQEKVEQIVVPEGRYSITSYDKKSHEMTGMTYRVGHYIVMFKKDGENIKWDVDYVMNIYEYSEFDVKLENE